MRLHTPGLRGPPGAHIRGYKSIHGMVLTTAWQSERSQAVRIQSKRHGTDFDNWPSYSLVWTTVINLKLYLMDTVQSTVLLGRL
jgi:hypothetical protein